MNIKKFSIRSNYGSKLERNSLPGSGLILSEPKWTIKSFVSTLISNTMTRMRNPTIQRIPLNDSVGRPLPQSTLIALEYIQKVLGKGSVTLESKNPKDQFQFW